ncbi:hypothetical protein [Kovacikia minuta]|nr:hypothetical protein [Kovacikia minuta]
MNAEFAQWLTNSIPVNWTRYRDQWEYAHARWSRYPLPSGG